MADFKDKVKSFREMAEKLGVCGHTMMAADYRWAADTIDTLQKRNDVQKASLMEKLTVITTMTSHLHEVESELQKVINRLHEVESERDAAIAGQETLQKELARYAEAENEGRLIIAPAKIVYEPVWDAGPDCDMKCPERFDGEETCEGCSKAVPWAHERPWKPGDEIGKTVFLTVPEAEHALLVEDE